MKSVSDSVPSGNHQSDGLFEQAPSAETAAPTTRIANRVDPTDETDVAPDPFDLERLRLGQDFATGLGVKKALLTVPVRKPAREWWVQVNPDPAYRLETYVLELKEDRETYLVDRGLWHELATESTVSTRAIFTAINRQGVIFLWPVRLPGPDGKTDNWSRSAIEAAELAQGRWSRVQANMSLGAYEIFQASVELPDPEWPDLSFRDLLRIAFKDRHIVSLDHPVLRRLRGEA